MRHLFKKIANAIIKNFVESLMLINGTIYFR